MEVVSISNHEVLELVKEAKKNFKNLTHITDKKKLSYEDKMKIALCKHFVQHMNDKRITLTNLSKDLKMPKSRVSEIVNYKISKFSVGKLMENLLMLATVSPKTRAYLELLEEAFAFPYVSVTQTKKATRKIRESHSYA
jgi:predicted XRE-type DNA-binding protein